MKEYPALANAAKAKRPVLPKNKKVTPKAGKATKAKKAKGNDNSLKAFEAKEKTENATAKAKGPGPALAKPTKAPIAKALAGANKAKKAALYLKHNKSSISKADNFFAKAEAKKSAKPNAKKAKAKGPAQT